VKSARTYHHPDLRATLVAEGLRQLERVGTDLSLRAVAKSLGVSPAAPFRHFADRAEFMGALAAEGFVQFTLALTTGREFEPMEALKALGSAYLGFARDHPSLYRLMFSAAGYSLNHPACREAANQAFGTLINAVTRAQNSGWKPGKDEITLATAYWAVLHGWAGISGDGLMPPGVTAMDRGELLDVYLS